MIYAVKNNKINRNLYKANEDSLTSAIFERLMYLPKELFQNILKEALYEDIPNLNLEKIESIEYWPYWGAGNTGNTQSVEPDIFIRTESHDLIIEAKRYDHKQQYKGQWLNEKQAYLNEYQEDEKDLIFIALGGLHTIETEAVMVQGKTYQIHKCQWSGILKAVKDIRYKLEMVKGLTNSSTAIDNILGDIILCFALFGFSTADWFERFLQPVHITQRGINYFSKSWTN